MSETMAEPEDRTEIKEQDVIAFLKANPKFLQKNPDVCDFLLPPKENGGRNVADFQAFMIQRLKADKHAVLESTREIVETSRANMNNQQRVHKAVLLLLEAATFDDFIQTITLDLAAILDIDIAALVVESNGREIPQVNTAGIRIVPQGTIDRWMSGKSVLLQSNISGIEAIFGGGATLVGSQALLRVDISMNTPPAVLAFGSRDPDLFEDGQATDQVAFLARVVERCFRAWLSLPS